jgi:hypothetical protein
MRGISATFVAVSSLLGEGKIMIQSESRFVTLADFVEREGRNCCEAISCQRMFRRFKGEEWAVLIRPPTGNGKITP